jgi:squalene-hopene/tetraprenyl-beta-curcumene cyclase
VGEDMTLPYVKRAKELLVARQGADGGWQERPDSDPHPPSRAPGMPAVTASAVLALLALESNARTEAVERGVGFLLEEQRADGGWNNAGFLYGLSPPELLFEYALPALALPILALSRYRAARSSG